MEYRSGLDEQARYVLANFADKNYGEWFNTIEPNGKVSGEKTGEWKGAYHPAALAWKSCAGLKKTP